MRCVFFCKDENLIALKWIDNKSVHIATSHINSLVSEKWRDERKDKLNRLKWIVLISIEIITSTWGSRSKRSESPHTR